MHASCVVSEMASPSLLTLQAAMMLPLPPAAFPRNGPQGRVILQWGHLLGPWGSGNTFPFANNPKGMKGWFLNPHSTANPSLWLIVGVSWELRDTRKEEQLRE